LSANHTCQQLPALRAKHTEISCEIAALGFENLIVELSRLAPKTPPSTAQSTATAGPPQGGLVCVQSSECIIARNNPQQITQHNPVNLLIIKATFGLSFSAVVAACDPEGRPIESALWQGRLGGSPKISANVGSRGARGKCANLRPLPAKQGEGKSTPRRAPLGVGWPWPLLLETTGAHDWTVTGWLMQELAQKGHFCSSAD